MRITRRSLGIAGVVAAVAVAGAVITGPASAFARSGGWSGGPGSPGGTASFGMMGGRGGGMMGGFDADGDGRPESATVGGPMMRGRGFGPMMGWGGMLHSEGVVASVDPSGTTTYVTVRMQRGKVTSASATSITITSDDTVSYIWPLSSTTRLYRNGKLVTGSAFATGDVVMAEGTVAGGSVSTNLVSSLGWRHPVAPLPGTSWGRSTNA